MTTKFDLRKTASVLVCTILFSATCVLSAVGPARADDVGLVRTNPAVAPLA